MKLDKKESLHALRVTLRANQYILKYLKREMLRYGLNENEFTVLELLYNKGPHTIQNIGQRILIPNSSLTYVIDKLEEKRLVKRKASSQDKRIINVAITQTGKEKMATAFESHTKCIEEIFAEFSKDEIEQYIKMQKKVGYQAQHLFEIHE